MAENGKNSSGGTASPVSAKTLIAVAICLVIFYVVALVALYSIAADDTTSDVVWSRYVVLLSGLEAIVFTAVGWMFGREVNRQRAEAAEDAKKKADDAKDESQAQLQQKERELATARATGEGLKTAILVTDGPGDFVAYRFNGDQPPGAVNPAAALQSLRLYAESTQF